MSLVVILAKFKEYRLFTTHVGKLRQASIILSFAEVSRRSREAVLRQEQKTRSRALRYYVSVQRASKKKKIDSKSEKQVVIVEG